MRHKIITTLLLVITALMFSGCDSSKKEKAIINDYLPELNSGFMTICSGCSLFDNVTFTLDDKTLEVDIKLGPDVPFTVDQLSDALIQYCVSYYLKNNTGARLDAILNALGHMQGKAEIKIVDNLGDSKECEISSMRLKQLVRLRPMELNFNEVRSNILEIMNGKCELYKLVSNAVDANFRYQGGFAEYTMTFSRPQDYRQFNQANLAGKFVNILKPQYESYGAMRPFVQGILESLQIEGYRFIYTAGEDRGTIRSTIPWRLLH